MISAIILAAGASKRMGQPKMLLPWGNTTILEHVISVFVKAKIDDIVVITGGAREQVENIISRHSIQFIYNEQYSTGEMLSSIKFGLRALSPHTDATLIGLGDQPQLQEGSVQRVCNAFRKTKANIIVPSYRMRRGHPWLVTRQYWNELLEMKAPLTPRFFLNAHSNEIHYVNIDDPHILADLDTPEDYQKWHP